MAKKQRRSNVQRSEVIRYTPELAKEILERNELNRYISWPTVHKYANIMKRQGWRSDNGAAIKIDRAGKLKDGQHRLLAVKEAGVPVHILTTFNVAEDCFDTIDCGKPRRTCDIISILNVPNYTTVSGALTLCYREECGNLASAAIPDNDMIEGLLERHAKLVDSVATVVEIRHQVRGLKGLFPQSLAAYLHYRFSQKDPEAATRFFEQLYTGEDLKKTNPVYRLREKFVADMASTTKLPRIYKMVYAIKAWNATRNGGTLGLLRWSSTEQFPAIA